MFYAQEDVGFAPACKTILLADPLIPDCCFPGAGYTTRLRPSTETWRLIVLFNRECIHDCICIFIESLQIGEFAERSHPAVKNETSSYRGLQGGIRR